MCVWLCATRIPALQKHGIVYDPRRPPEEFHAQLPADVRWKADSYNNLSGTADDLLCCGADAGDFGYAGSGLNAGLAWAYVTSADRPQPCPSAHQQGHDQVCTFRSSVAGSTGYDDPRRVDYIFAPTVARPPLWLPLGLWSANGYEPCSGHSDRKANVTKTICKMQHTR